MPFFIPALIAGASALSGYLNSRKKKIETESSGSTSFDNTSTATPTYDAKALNVRDRLLNELLSRTEEGPSFVDNIVKQGTLGINESSGINRKILENLLRSRGLSRSGSAVAGVGGIETHRLQQIAALQNQAPILQDQITRDRLGDLSSFFSSLPVGQTTRTTGTGTQQSSGTQNLPGSALGGAFGGAAETLAYLYGKGKFGSGGSSGGGFLDS